MTTRLDDGVVVITGAAQGLGREFARSLAALGASVVLADLQERRAAEAAEEIRAAGGTAVAFPLDITDEASNLDLVRKTTAEFGRIDILINNAALYTDLGTDWLTVDLDEWDRVMRINVRGVWQTSRAVAPCMRENGGGKIVNLSSFAAWGSRLMHYASSKTAVIGLTRSMAKVLGPDNITVNALAPGMIATEAFLSEASQSPVELERRMARQALRRMGQPSDLTGVVAFLCSPAADWMTGQVLVVDGGGTMV